MLSALVALISLNLTLTLIQDYGVIAQTWTITDATTASPIVITCTAHGVPLGRVVHGIVSGVGGMPEADGLWIATPLDADRFALSTLTAQGLPQPSSGVGTYSTGGQLQAALPEWSILLGRRNLDIATSPTSPRFTFIPCAARAWDFEPYGGANPSLQPAQRPPVRGSLEQQSMSLAPQLATEFPTFEVWIHGCAPDFGAPGPAPDGADFDAAQALAHILYGVLFDATGGLPRARILHQDWPSQMPDSGTMTQRGQVTRLFLEMQSPVTKPPASFAPIGVTGAFTVQPVNPASGDPIVINVT